MNKLNDRSYWQVKSNEHRLIVDDMIVASFMEYQGNDISWEDMRFLTVEAARRMIEKMHPCCMYE